MAGNELAVNHDGNMVKTGFKNVLTFHIELYIWSLKILTKYSHRFLKILCNVGEKYELMRFDSAHFRSACQNFHNFWPILKTSYILIPIGKCFGTFLIQNNP